MELRGKAKSLEELAEQTIADAFDQAVLRFGNRPALFDGDRFMTFHELGRTVHQIAHAIQVRTGRERSPIVLLMDQRPSAVAGFLAILKAGKVCVAANPINNEARFLKTIFSDMSPPLVLTCGEHLPTLQSLGIEAAALDMNDFDGVSTEVVKIPSSADGDIVVYTSGTTGIPKGVLHSQRNILHRAFWYASSFDIGPSDATIMLSAPDHISGLVGVLRALLTGGRLFMWSIRTQGLVELARHINDHDITILPIVNSVFRRLTDEVPADFLWPTLRMVIIGGEPAYREDVLRFRRHCLPGSLLINTLGCTELPTYRYFPIDHETELTGASVPAGHAVPGADATIVRDDGTEAVNGEIGEIVVGSRYLALGYSNLPAETATKFVSKADGTRLFRTGDLGTISEDGMLKHVGRKDSLVKILGNRVELGEIEAALRLHPAVRDACVVAQPNDSSNSGLCAFVAPHDMPGPAREDLKSHLRAQLPDYMIPAQIEYLSLLPLNRNGKIDRKALEMRKSASPFEPTIQHPPQTDTERRVAQICQAVLGMDSIDIDQNLFDLGANSILAMMMASRLMIAFGVELPRTLVFDLPTVSGLARFLSPDDEGI